MSDLSPNEIREMRNKATEAACWSTERRVAAVKELSLYVLRALAEVELLQLEKTQLERENAELREQLRFHPAGMVWCRKCDHPTSLCVCQEREADDDNHPQPI